MTTETEYQNAVNYLTKLLNGGLMGERGSKPLRIAIEACEALDSCGVKFELDGGDRIMVEDELRQDALSVFDEYDIDAEEV